MDSVVLAKAFAILAILGAGVLGGLLPWRVARLSNSQTYLGWGNAFAGGVLLAAGLIHLLGDAASGFAAIWPNVDFPWAFTIAAGSFLLILGLERVLPRTPRLPVGSVDTRDLIDPEADSIAEAALGSRQYPYLLLLTLSIHSLIAGMALGAQTSLAGFLILLIAILAHKSAAGFSLGVSLQRIGVPIGRARTLVLGFAVMTPLGVILGSLIAALLDSSGEQVFEALFDAIAAGTFIYIASLDILREEFLPPREGRRIKWLFSAAGLTLMALVAIWT